MSQNVLLVSLKPAGPRARLKSPIMPKWCQCAPDALSMLTNLRPALSLFRVTARVCAGLAARQLNDINGSARASDCDTTAQGGSCKWFM